MKQLPQLLILEIGQKYELLLELVDQDIYRKLCDRIEAGALPILKPEGGLDFPYITFELNTQNSFYTKTNEAFRSKLNPNDVTCFYLFFKE